MLKAYGMSASVSVLLCGRDTVSHKGNVQTTRSRVCEMKARPTKASLDLSYPSSDAEPGNQVGGPEAMSM